MAVNLSPLAGAGWQFFSDAGVPLTGGKLYTYAAGTTTPQATYTSSTGLTANSNPIILNAAGRLASEVWLTSNLNYKFVLKTSTDVTIGTYDNIAGLLDSAALSNTTDNALGDALVGFKQAGSSGFLSGATARTVSTKLQEVVSVKDFGATGDGTTNDLTAFQNAANSASVTQILVPAGAYYLSAVPVVSGSVTWVIDRNATFTGTDILTYINNRIVSYGGYESIESDPAFYNGIFGYLEQNSALSGYGTMGLHGSARTIGGAGGSGEVDIAVSAFGYNDIQGGLGGLWGLYATVLRAPTGGGGAILGATHGLEIDVANMGTTVAIYPAAPFQAGLTAGAWICSGGEVTVPSAGGSPGAASVGIGIIQNDSQVVKTSSFEKGILFHNTAILGTDGATGTGIAIAFATGHSMIWYNNSTQACAEITATGRTYANTGMRLDFAETGVVFQDRTSGVNALAIIKSAAMVNGINISGSNTGSPVKVSAAGTDTNIDLILEAQGVGVLDLRGIASVGTAGASAGYLPIKINGVLRKIQIYNT